MRLLAAFQGVANVASCFAITFLYTFIRRVIATYFSGVIAVVASQAFFTADKSHAENNNGNGSYVFHFYNVLLITNI